MGRNRLKKAFEKDGITVSSFRRCFPISNRTLKRVLAQRRTVSPGTQEMIVKAVNKICGRQYSVEELFPNNAEKVKRQIPRNNMSSGTVMKKENPRDLAETARQAAAAFKDAAKKGFRSS